MGTHHLLKLLSQGPEEETSAETGGRGGRRADLGDIRGRGPGLHFLCGALEGGQALVEATGQFLRRLGGY